MSQKVAEYLQQHLHGEVMTSPDALDYFSTDGGVFKLRPKIIVYPRNTSDVRKVARFIWQLAEKGHSLPITARGKGTDQAGAALGSGVMMVFPAHMNKILELDRSTVTIQPGIIYGKLEQTLHTHGRFLPPYPSSIEFSTVGGAIANNAAGEKTIKYGATRKYVRKLNVVLANGELIQTERLTKRELSKKKGLTTFEGEVYRELDSIITDNWELIQHAKLGVSKNAAGYALADVKDSKGTFDLTPLIVGSQGTLGIVTQAVLDTEPYNPNTSLIAAYFDDITKATDAVELLRKLNPSAMELVDEHLLAFVHKHNPAQLKDVISEPFPKLVVLIEFDDVSDRVRKKAIKKTQKILNEYAYEYISTNDEHDKEKLWKIRHSAAAVIWHVKGNAKALPIIEDGVVPHPKFHEYIQEVYAMYKQFGLDVAVWGHAGDANLHMQPFLDLTQIGDRQRVFKIADHYYNMVLKLGGSTSGEHNDGRLRAPYLPQVYGPDMYQVFKKVKSVFDPHNCLNPGVKLDVTQKDLVPLLRKEYSMEHLYDHMPRT